MSYEIKFIQRLARLVHTSIMAQIAYAFKYIDDLCWLNASNAKIFFGPTQPRMISNLYWIYPPRIIDIKMKVTYSQQ